jgi:hypothetical protein
MAGKSGANSPQPALREQVSKGNTEALPDTIPATWRAAVGDAEQPVEAGTSKTPVDTADERMDGKDATTRGQASASAAAEAAEAALKAIKDGAMRADAARRAGMVTVKETRRFAGQDVEIAREVKAGSKQAVSVQQRAEAAKARTGIDAVLSHIQGVALKLMAGSPSVVASCCSCFLFGFLCQCQQSLLILGCSHVCHWREPSFDR